MILFVRLTAESISRARDKLEEMEDKMINGLPKTGNLFTDGLECSSKRVASWSKRKKSTTGLFR